MHKERLIGKKLIVLDSVDSTNNYLSKFVNETIVLNGTVILAHNQTKGRGQRGNNWESEEGKNLTFSIYLKTDFLKLSQSFLLSMVLCNSIHELCTIYTNNAKIKWPNDIIIEEKKICGILIENSINKSYLSTSIVGIGFNLNQVKFSDSVNAISLMQQAGKELEKDAILYVICSLFEKNYFDLKNGNFQKIKNYYFKNLIGYNAELNYEWTATNEPFVGEILDVADTGLLKMKINQKEIKTIEMKEIRLV